VYSVFTETRTGTLLFGEPAGSGVPSSTWGNPTFKGITWDDVMVTTKSDATVLEARLSATGAVVDMDFELRTVGGQLITNSATTSANEIVRAAVQPNTTYVLRVLGWANGPATYQIVSNQLLPNGSPNGNGGTVTSGGSGPLNPATTAPISGLYRFTVNPVLKKVTFSLLR
jgi:hypothetical protein